MHFIGIDPSWKVKEGRTAIVVLDETLSLISSAHLTTDEEIVDFVCNYKNYCWVGIDAPLVIPKYMSKKRRRCDLEILRKGIGILPVSRTLYKRLYGGARGLKLVDLFLAEGFVLADFYPLQKCNALFEIYPLASWKALFSRLPKYKNVPRSQLVGNIKKIMQLVARLGIELSFAEIDLDAMSVTKLAQFTDFLDALIGAYTVYTFWQHGFEKCAIYGDKEEGFILNLKL